MDIGGQFAYEQALASVVRQIKSKEKPNASQEKQ